MLGNLRTPEAPTVPTPPVAVSNSATSVERNRQAVVDDTGLVRKTVYISYKRGVDLVVASLLAIVCVPIIFITAVLVKIFSPGPAFYTQTRMGQFGKPFRIVKIRTMTHRCEDKSGVRWSTPGDNRITFIGKILRKTHMDELPQLWNVFRGDMSLVGPRPERPEFFPLLEAAIPNYPKRLLVKPGVTGLAQAYLPPDEDISSVRKKQVYDLYYIRTLSLLLDLRLMVATAVQAVGAPCRLVRFLLRLPSPTKIEQPAKTNSETVLESSALPVQAL